MNKFHLLLVEDDRELSDLLVEFLVREGLEVTPCYDGSEGLKMAQEGIFDLMILDIMLPGLNGIEVLKQLRQSSDLPVLMMTAKGDDIDKIIGLELGADDYLPKPSNPRELLARIHAILRRTSGFREMAKQNSDPVVAIGDLSINPAAHQVQYKNRPITLTSTEFDILLILVQHLNKVVDKNALSRQALGKPLAMYDRSLDVHVSNIRKKLSTDDEVFSAIKTVRSVGYMYEN